MQHTHINAGRSTGKGGGGGGYDLQQKPKHLEFGLRAERNGVALSRVLNWDFVAVQHTQYGSLFHVTGPRWGKVHYP